MSVRKPSRSEGLVLAWVAGALIIVAALAAISDWNSLLTPVVLLTWLGIGVSLLIVLLIARQFRAAGLLAVLTPLLLFLSPVISSAGSNLWYQSQFRQSEAVYQDVIARTASLPDSGVMAGRAYRIARGPTTRIAFPLPGGVADNWSAVVHDPSDLVATAKGWGGTRGDYTADVDVRDLWGGKLLACRPITGHFYRCDFT